MGKDLKDKAIKIKGKDYVMVKDRINYLSENHGDKYSIETDYDYYPERLLWVVKATLTLNDSVFTGLAQEIESEDYKSVNSTSALENCETSAIGRACAMAGIGVLDSIASVDEMNKATNRGRGATEKQIKWMLDEAEKVCGTAVVEDWLEELLTIPVEQVPVYKVKDAIDLIRKQSKGGDVDTDGVEVTDEDLENIKEGLDNGKIPY